MDWPEIDHVSYPIAPDMQSCLNPRRTSGKEINVKSDLKKVNARRQISCMSSIANRE